MIFKDECFKNKRFVITGASSGIGAHIALMLNTLGAEIIALGRDLQKLESQKSKAKNPSVFHIITKDRAICWYPADSTDNIGAVCRKRQRTF